LNFLIQVLDGPSDTAHSVSLKHAKDDCADVGIMTLRLLTI